MVNTLSSSISNLNASSLEAHGPKNIIIVVPPSLEILSKLNEHNPTKLAEARTAKYVDDIDEAPWLHFISEPSMTSDTVEIFGPIDLEGSMENNPAITSGSRSMLSSYQSELSVRSDAASAIVQHAGAALAAPRPTPSNHLSPFLQLL